MFTECASGDEAENGTIKVWHIERGVELRTLVGHTGTVRQIAFSPGGKMLASASSDQTVRVWDVDTGEELDVLPNDRGFWARAVWLDEKLLATNHYCGIRLWDLDSGDMRSEFKAHWNAVFAMAVSPDGKTLVTGGEGRTVRLWSVPDIVTSSEASLEFDMTGPAKCKLVVSGAGYERSYGVAFSSDGQLLATAGDEATVSLWDVERRERVRVLRGHTGTIESLAFSPDGETLGSFSMDTTIRLWNVETGETVRVLSQNTFGAGPLAFSPDGKTLASSDWSDTVRLWDTASGALRKEFEAGWRWGVSLAFSPQGDMLVTGSGDFAARCWSVSQLAEGQAKSPAGPQPVTTCFLSASCTAFSGPDNTLAMGNWFGHLSLWQVDRWGAAVDVEVAPGGLPGETPGMGLL